MSGNEMRVNIIEGFRTTTGFPNISYLQNLRARLSMFRTELVDVGSEWRGELGLSVGGDSIILCAPLLVLDPDFTLYAGADTDISEMMNWILQHKCKARDDIS